MKVLGLIPARGGSKGVPRKNIRLLSGKPLLAYTAEAALQARSLTRVILSTEDQEIAEIGKQWGLDVPFMRPEYLAEDTTPTLPVVQHALMSLAENGESFDAVCLLQPTNPLRREQDIDACIELLANSGASSAVSMRPVPHEYNPRWVYWKSADGKLSLSAGEGDPITRRQDLPSAFYRDGSIYVSRSETVLNGSLYGPDIVGYEMPPEFSANIDTEADWQAIEERILRRTAGAAK